MLPDEQEQPVGSASVGIAEISHTAAPLEDAGNVMVPAPQRSLSGSLLAGVFSVGGALAVERGAGFVANLLAAHIAGTAVFGAYSISLNTANNVASYAGAGMGTTATRFIAEYPEGGGRRQVIRTILLFALLSATLAAILLWFTAEPLARKLLNNAALARPLKVAAISAAAFVALECCRGVFIGTREFKPFLFLSGLVGVGSLLAIPTLAHLGATYMVAGQAGAVLLATIVSAVLILQRQGKKPVANGAKPDKVSLAKVWRFGLVQLGGVVGLNAAGWWTATLVTRGDSTLSQVAFYTVATQWRNLCGMLPNMVQQGNFAFFTDNGSANFGGATRVVSVSAVFASILAVLCAGFVIVPIPFILRHSYGAGYAATELPAAFAIATVIVHLGISPASSRLTVISLRWTAVINAIWSVIVIAAGTMLIPTGGATAATATLFAAHVLSAVLTLFALWRLNDLPRGLTNVAGVNIALALMIGSLAWWRAIHPEHALLVNSLLLLIPVVGTLLLFRLGQSCGAIPRKIDWTSLFRTVSARLPFKSLRTFTQAA